MEVEKFCVELFRMKIFMSEVRKIEILSGMHKCITRVYSLIQY